MGSMRAAVTKLNPPYDYIFWTDCVSSVGDLINEMRDNEVERQVTYDTMLAHADGLIDRSIELNYERRVTSGSGITLKHDPYVSFHRSFYCGVPCYYFVWSGIEQIWIKKGYEDKVADCENAARADDRRPSTSLLAKQNPVVPKLLHLLSEGDVDLLDRLESEALELTRMAEEYYNLGDFQEAEDYDAAAEEAWQYLENVTSEVMEGGEPLTGGSQFSEGWETNISRFMAKIWAEHLHQLKTGWSHSSLELSDPQDLANYIRMVLKGEWWRTGGFSEDVTDDQLLDAARDAYEARAAGWERGRKRVAREDEVLAKLGDIEAQRRQLRRGMARENPGGLQKRTARPRSGELFETGTPVTFRFMRNTEPSWYMGSQFGQDIEPSGTYMLLDDYEIWRDPPEKHAPSWVFGEKTLSSPLVIATVADDNSDSPTYGPLGWKRRLSEAYGGKTGSLLTRAILESGHDGVVTVGPALNDVREIVDLTRMTRSAALRAKKNQ